MINTIYFGDNLGVLRQMSDETIDLIYIDPPFNTGKKQSRQQLKTSRSIDGDRVGFGDHSYSTEVIGKKDYTDSFDDYLAFLQPRLEEARRVLKPNGSLYFHIDYREAHYCKVMLDHLFGRQNFINEIIWAYDFGGRARDRWPAKHDNILFYAKNASQFTFNRDDIDRIPYMAPGLVSAEKAELGKLPTDTWWHTIVGTNSKEKTGYPTQKPLGILERIIRASSNQGEMVLDFFAGSGTTGEACLRTGRFFTMIDSNPQAIEVMKKRFSNRADIEFVTV